MPDSRPLLRLGAFGAGLSTLLLIVIALLSLITGLEYPGLAVLTGQLTLSAAEQLAYLNGMRLLFVLDGFFLAGWLLAWVGLFHLVHARSPLFGWLTLAFGLAGALCDFGENSLVWGAMQNLQTGAALNADWVIGWKAVQHLSYWLPFLGAMFAAPSLWPGGWDEKAAALAGSVLLVPAVFGLYDPSYFLLAYGWFLIWFLVIGLLLWKSSSHFVSPRKEGIHV